MVLKEHIYLMKRIFSVKSIVIKIAMLKKQQNLPEVLYWYEYWPFKMRENRSVLSKRWQKKNIGKNTEEMRDGWRSFTVRNFSLNSSPSIIKMHNSMWIRLAEHVASMEQIINSYEILVRNSKRKVTLRTYAHKLDDNIKIYHK